MTASAAHHPDHAHAFHRTVFARRHLGRFFSVSAHRRARVRAAAAHRAARGHCLAGAAAGAANRRGARPVSPQTLAAAGRRGDQLRVAVHLVRGRRAALGRGLRGHSECHHPAVGGGAGGDAVRRADRPGADRGTGRRPARRGRAGGRSAGVVARRRALGGGCGAAGACVLWLCRALRPPPSGRGRSGAHRVRQPAHGHGAARSARCIHLACARGAGRHLGRRGGAGRAVHRAGLCGVFPPRGAGRRGLRRLGHLPHSGVRHALGRAVSAGSRHRRHAGGLRDHPGGHRAGERTVEAVGGPAGVGRSIPGGLRPYRRFERRPVRATFSFASGTPIAGKERKNRRGGIHALRRWVQFEKGVRS